MAFRNIARIHASASDTRQMCTRVCHAWGGMSVLRRSSIRKVGSTRKWSCFRYSHHWELSPLEQSYSIVRADVAPSLCMIIAESFHRRSDSFTTRLPYYRVFCCQSAIMFHVNYHASSQQQLSQQQLNIGWARPKCGERDNYVQAIVREIATQQRILLFF